MCIDLFRENLNEWKLFLKLQLYRVTHKGWDLRDNCTKFVKYVLLHSGFLVPCSLFLVLCSLFLVPCKSKLEYFLIFELNPVVKCQLTQLNGETKDQASKTHIFSVLGRLYSLILCGQPCTKENLWTGARWIYAFLSINCHKVSPLLKRWNHSLYNLSWKF